MNGVEGRWGVEREARLVWGPIQLQPEPPHSMCWGFQRDFTLVAAKQVGSLWPGSRRRQRPAELICWLQPTFCFLQQRFGSHPPLCWRPGSPHLLPMAASPRPSWRPPTILRRAPGWPCSGCPCRLRGSSHCQGPGLPPKTTRERPEYTCHPK